MDKIAVVRLENGALECKTLHSAISTYKISGFQDGQVTNHDNFVNALYDVKAHIPAKNSATRIIVLHNCFVKNVCNFNSVHQYNDNDHIITQLIVDNMEKAQAHCSSDGQSLVGLFPDAVYCNGARVDILNNKNISGNLATDLNVFGVSNIALESIKDCMLAANFKPIAFVPAAASAAMHVVFNDRAKHPEKHQGQSQEHMVLYLDTCHACVAHYFNGYLKNITSISKGVNFLQSQVVKYLPKYDDFIAYCITDSNSASYAKINKVINTYFQHIIHMTQKTLNINSCHGIHIICSDFLHKKIIRFMKSADIRHTVHSYDVSIMGVLGIFNILNNKEIKEKGSLIGEFFDKSFLI